MCSENSSLDNFFARLNSSCRSPSWKYGCGTAKPFSVVQSLFLVETAHFNRQNYDLQAQIFRQLQKSRVMLEPSGTEEENKETGSARRCDYPGTVENSREGAKSQHILLSSTSQSGPLLGVLDERLLWRNGGKSSTTVAFARLEPDLSRTFALKFKIETEKTGKFGEDQDIYYPDINGPVDSEFLNELHSRILVIPKGGEGLKVYSNETGKLQEKLHFPGPVVYHKVSCHENGNIILEGKKSTLPKGVSYEFLILQHPPWRVAARVQICSTVTKDAKNSPSRFEIVGDFFIGFCPANFIKVYDLEGVLKNGFPGNTCGNKVTVSHIVLALPEPLLCVKTLSSYLAFYHSLPAYFVTKETSRFKVNEVSSTGVLEVGSIAQDKLDDTKTVSFMMDQPPRLVCKGQTTIRVFRIDRGSDEKGNYTGSQLTPVFDENFSTTSNCIENDDRQGLRSQPRVSYADEDITLGYEESPFLQQFAVIRFAEGSFEAYLYDSVIFQKLYQVSVEHFSPSSSEIYDEITVHFTNSFIAVKRKGSGNTSLYLLALLRGLQ